MASKIKDKDFYKVFFTMTFTLAFQNLIVYGVNLADSVMMGAYNETALSGVGICNNIQFLLMMAVTGTCNGMTVIASQYWGKIDKRNIKSVSAVSVWVSIAFAVALTLACAFAPEWVIRLFTDKEAVIAQAVEYLDVIKYTYLIYALTTVLLAILRSVETVKIGFYVSLSSFAINILLNYTLIYGKFSMPEMGVRGAAVATLVARAIELAVVVIYTLAIDIKLQFKVTELSKQKSRCSEISSKQALR